MQPPPRGCVLKPFFQINLSLHLAAAASARLCVETLSSPDVTETSTQPPPRGCVLKLLGFVRLVRCCGSRLRAAVC